MHRLTPDSLTCLLLRKLNDSIDDRFIKCIYEHDQYLNRTRNLDIDRYLLFTFITILNLTFITHLNLIRNLCEMLDEAHHANLLNARAADPFAPLLQHPAQKIVVFSWGLHISVHLSFIKPESAKTNPPWPSWLRRCPSL